VLKKHLFTISFVSWLVLITLASLFSFSEDVSSGINIPYFDKIVHFIFHCVLVIFGVFSFIENQNDVFNLKKALNKLVLFSIIYGISIEVLQYVMPFNRAAEIWDVLANTLGAFAGVLLIKKYLSLTAK